MKLPTRSVATLLGAMIVATACGPAAGTGTPTAVGSAIAGVPTATPCASLRKVSLGVSTAPPNVVHTPPYVAKELGIFAKHCLDAEIVEFEGGLSATNLAAVAQGKVLASLNEVAIQAGLKGKQVWGMAPRLPHVYMVAESIKTAADLKGKRLSAAGGGVGSFNWRMGREVLKSASLTVDDAQFISTGTAARLPGLLAGQIEGVALHPEDVFLAQKEKPGLRVLTNLDQLLPLYFFNAYGVADSKLAEDRSLIRDVVASLIETNRFIYQNKAKVIPIMVKATQKPEDAVSFGYDFLVKNCIWSVNTGFNRPRTEWSIQSSVDNKDIEPSQRLKYEDIVAESLGNEALALVGGATTINGCKD
jgi:ABC-type nitrate/sulfonate/bicarbonate transport system substrate-binding protein